MAKGLNQYCCYILEQLEDFGSCSARPMFGGYGLYHKGCFFALIAEDELYIKADNTNRKHFSGLDPFTYTTKKGTATMSYFRMNESIIEEKNELAHWATLGYQAALRNPPKSKKRKKS